MYLQPNTILQGGKYRIKRFINSGGFGCTYEAEHTSLGKRVAIKEFFVKDFCNRDESTASISVATQGKQALVNKLKSKFIEEAKALSRLYHPCVVSVFDVFEENGTAYYVMDFINGSSLSEVLKREGTLSEKRALEYIRQVADALAYVHKHNRLHLDIKPGNIMIDDSGHAILIDFGASKQYEEDGGENTSTIQGYTNGYASIEQMANAVLTFTPSTDIYSLGATLHKLLTGVTPPIATLRACGEQLCALPASVSTTTREAIATAMQLNRQDRPQSMGAFLALLGAKAEARDDEETLVVGVEEEHREEDKRKLQKKQSKKWLWPLLVGLVAVAAFFGVRAYNNLSAENARLAAIVEQHRLDSIAARDALFKAEGATGIINGYRYVDLGLSVKWATCNVGASSPSDYGDYYAWGDTITKSSYTATNSITSGLPKNKLNTFGIIGSDGNLTSVYDAASVNWGGTWRMPTFGEIKELNEKCSWRWTTMKGVSGYKVTGLNGNSIFLPAAGNLIDGSHNGAGSYAHYWSTTPYGDSSEAYYLYFYSNSHYSTYSYRYYGFTVRPVSE